MPPNTFRGCATGSEGMPAYSIPGALTGDTEQIQTKSACNEWKTFQMKKQNQKCS